MSTISERVAAAFKAATGEDKDLSGGWHAANATHSLEVRNILGTRRREAIAQVSAKDSMNVKYWAERCREWTNVEVMTHMLLDAEQRANALAALANVDVAARFARDAFEVALERVQAGSSGWSATALAGPRHPT